VEKETKGDLKLYYSMFKQPRSG